MNVDPIYVDMALAIPNANGRQFLLSRVERRPKMPDAKLPASPNTSLATER